jgi:hypothetical protein
MRETNLPAVNTILLVILIGLVTWSIYRKPYYERTVQIEHAGRFQPYLDKVDFALDTTTGNLCRTSAVFPIFEAARPPGWIPAAVQPAEKLPICSELK